MWGFAKVQRQITLKSSSYRNAAEIAGFNNLFTYRPNYDHLWSMLTTFLQILSAEV